MFPYLKSDLECDISGYTNLHFSIWNDDLPKFHQLLTNPDVNVNSIDMYDYYTPLSYAVRKDNSEMVQSLLAHPKLDFWAEDAYGQTSYNYMKGFAGPEVTQMITDYANKHPQKYSGDKLKQD